MLTKNEMSQFFFLKMLKKKNQMYFWRLVRLFLYSNKVCSSRLLVFFTNGISDLPLSAVVVIVVVVPLEYTSLTGSALRHTCLSAAIKSGLKPPPASSNSVWQTSLGRKNSKFHAWCRRSEPGNVKDFLRVLVSKPTAQVLAAAAPLYWHPLSYDLRGGMKYLLHAPTHSSIRRGTSFGFWGKRPSIE